MASHERIQVEKALVSFSGWSDAARIAELTLGELMEQLPFELATTWDMDGFWQVEQSRPRVRIHHGQVQRIEWPRYDFFVSNLPSRRPFLVGMGPEPGCRWHAFVSHMLRSLKGWGCKELILLGGFYDQIFHDEVIVSGTAWDSEGMNRLRELQCGLIDYEGPCSVQSAILEASADHDIRCLCVWAHLPFYISGPNELAMAHLLRLLAGWLELEVDTRSLEQAWALREKEIEELVEGNEELQQILEETRKEAQDAASRQLTSKILRMDEFRRRRRSTDPSGE